MAILWISSTGGGGVVSSYTLGKKEKSLIWRFLQEKEAQALFLALIHTRRKK